MLSAVYVAYETDKLERELKLVRHFLLHPNARSVREAFIEQEAKEYEEGYARFLAQKRDRDTIDDLTALAIGPSFRKWLAGNLHLIGEFSEDRLKQMEILIRHAMSESFLLKAVANILWKYPDLWVTRCNKRMKFSWRRKDLNEQAKQFPGSERPSMLSTKVALRSTAFLVLGVLGRERGE
jgi:hypothetical protein